MSSGTNAHKCEHWQILQQYFIVPLKKLQTNRKFVNRPMRIRKQKKINENSFEWLIKKLLKERRLKISNVGHPSIT